MLQIRTNARLARVRAGPPRCSTPNMGRCSRSAWLCWRRNDGSDECTLVSRPSSALLQWSQVSNPGGDRRLGQSEGWERTGKTTVGTSVYLVACVRAFDRCASAIFGWREEGPKGRLTGAPPGSAEPRVDCAGTFAAMGLSWRRCAATGRIGDGVLASGDSMPPKHTSRLKKHLMVLTRELQYRTRTGTVVNPLRPDDVVMRDEPVED